MFHLPHSCLTNETHAQQHAQYSYFSYSRRQQVKEVLLNASSDMSHLLHSCLTNESHANNMLNIQVRPSRDMTMTFKMFNIKN
jgi:hypothetical protein